MPISVRLLRKYVIIIYALGYVHEKLLGQQKSLFVLDYWIELFSCPVSRT